MTKLSVTIFALAALLSGCERNYRVQTDVVAVTTSGSLPAIGTCGATNEEESYEFLLVALNGERPSMFESWRLMGDDIATWRNAEGEVQLRGRLLKEDELRYFDNFFVGLGSTLERDTRFAVTCCPSTNAADTILDEEPWWLWIEFAGATQVSHDAATARELRMACASPALSGEHAPMNHPSAVN